MWLALIFDGVLMLLLSVAIYYGVVLSRRLAALRNGEAEMRAKLDEFSAAVARAETALAGLKGAAHGDPQAGHAAADRDLTAQSEVLRDDLRYLLERGEAMLRRASLAAQADGASSPPASAPDAPMAAPAAPAPPAGAGQALRRAVQAGLAAGPQKSAAGALPRGAGAGR